jgi:hypothetical protein
MSRTPKQIIEDTKRLRGERTQLNQLWEEVAEVLSPERIGFVGQTRKMNRRTDKIFDTQPITSKRALVNSLGAMLRPKSSAPGKWFDIVPEDESLLDDRESKEWIDFAEERLWKSLYNPAARFIETTGEVDDDLVTFGTGTGFLGLRPDQKGFLFRSFHMNQVYIEVNSANVPESYYIIERLNPEQAAGRWGKENLGNKTIEKLEDSDKKKATEKQDFYWCVTTRNDRDPRIKNNKNMPIQSIVIDVDSEHTVVEEGFEELPFFTPRWDTRSGEVYGRGVGVLALPDVLTLNQMGKTMLRGLHRAVDPPWLLPSDSMVSAPQMRPGGVAYYDAKAVRNLGISDPFRQMDSKANIPWGLNAQTAAREQIQVLFFKNILNLPIAGPQMTATEILERREQFVREIGAVFGRLESDYTGPMVERAFNLMLRSGALGDEQTIPEAIQQVGVNFRFASPIEKAKRQIEEATVGEGIQKILEIGQIQPSVMNRVNWDEVGKFIAESGDFPPQLTLDDKEVAALNQQQAQQQQEQQSLQAVQQVANIAGSVPPDMVAQAQEAASEEG